MKLHIPYISRPITSVIKSALVRHARCFGYFAAMSTLCLLSTHAVYADGAGPSTANFTTPTLGADSAYSLSTSTGTGDITISKYVVEESTGAITSTHSYDVLMNTELGDPAGSDVRYYKWVDDENGNRVLDTATSADKDVSIRVDPSDQSRDIIEAGENAVKNVAGWSHTITTTEGFKRVSDTDQNASIQQPLLGTNSTTDSGTTISGDFVNNSTKFNMVDFYADHADLYADVILNDIYDKSITTSVLGGVISLGRDHVVNEISGSFVGNRVETTSTYADDDYYMASASGGAVYIGRDENRPTETTVLGLLKADFIGNSIHAYAQGIDGKDGVIINEGAALAAKGATLTEVQGDFIGNYIYTESPGSPSRLDANGGAVFLNEVTMENMSSDFLGNGIIMGERSGTSNKAIGRGSGLYMFSTSIKTLTGDFIGNYGWHTEKSHSIGVGLHVSGNYSEITNLTGSFIGNISLGDHTGLGSMKATRSDQGMAMYLSGAKVGLVTDGENIVITGNYSITKQNASGGGVEYLYDASDAIYVVNTTLALDAYDGDRIIINDGIYSFYEKNAIIKINEGSADHTGTNASVVEINNSVDDITINHLAGTLILGEYAGGESLTTNGFTYDTLASHAALFDSVLNIEAGATVDAFSGEAFKQAGVTTVNTNTINNYGNLIIREGEMRNKTTMYADSTTELHSDAAILEGFDVRGANAQVVGKGSEARVFDSTSTAETITIYEGNLTMSNLTLSAAGTVDNQVTSRAMKLDGVTIDGLSVAATTSTTTAGEAGIADMTASATVHLFDVVNVADEINASIATNGLTLDIQLSGALLTEFDGYLAQMMMGGELAVGFKLDGALIHVGDIFGSSEEMTALDQLSVLLKVNGETFAVNHMYKDTTDNSHVFTLESIPEPSTATLSLLALTGLLARRRRKA